MALYTRMAAPSTTRIEAVAVPLIRALSHLASFAAVDRFGDFSSVYWSSSPMRL